MHHLSMRDWLADWMHRSIASNAKVLKVCCCCCCSSVVIYWKLYCSFCFNLTPNCIQINCRYSHQRCDLVAFKTDTRTEAEVVAAVRLLLSLCVCVCCAADFETNNSSEMHLQGVESNRMESLNESKKVKREINICTYSQLKWNYRL